MPYVFYQDSMRDLKDIRQFWHDRVDENLALCTLVHKSGSSYRGLGAKKIVARDRGSSGLLSGGCLEADIEKTARDKWQTMPFRQSFSTMNEEDRLLGYQAGCAGVIDILFEPLPNDTNDIELWLPFGIHKKMAGVCVSLDPKKLGARKWVSQPPDPHNDIFFDAWQSPIELSIIGCGPDAKAFLELAEPLGWNLGFFDYRQSYVASMPLGFARHLPAKQITDVLPQGKNAAVILMTHNYQADLDIMAGLVDKSFGYIGCLGPRQRYEQLKQDLQKLYGLIVPLNWDCIVHAPAGLLIKSQTPEDIALTTLAQIQTMLAGHD